MPQIKYKSIGEYLNTQHSTLRNVCDQIKEKLNTTDTLKELGNKIEIIMFDRGSAVSIMPFLERMIFKGVKTQTKPNGYKGEPGECLGKGHFRNGKAYTLTEQELKEVIKLFKWLRG